ncbi:MAG: M50 family metallopeptidase [Acidimicrobiales bacterium]
MDSRGASLAVAEPDQSPPELSRAGTGSSAASIYRLGLVVLAGILVSVFTHTFSTVAVVAAVILMIMLHELGHFATAKWGRMKVTEYFLGFGPRLWSIRRGETEYGIKVIPAGGYCKIVGMVNVEPVAPEDEARSYRQASFPRRLSVALAGSAVHFILAFVILWVLFAFVGTPATNKVSVTGLSAFDSVASPAQQAGFRPGDVIQSVNGQRITSPDQLAGLVGSSIGHPLTVVVRRDGHRATLVVTPVDEQGLKSNGAAILAPGSKPTGIIGIELGAPNATVNPLVSLGRSAEDLGKEMVTVVQALGHVFSPHGVAAYTHEVFNPNSSSGPSASAVGAPRFASPVGVVRLASQAAHSGLTDTLTLLFSINVFVGVFNLFPMLPLDGGHVVIAVYERLRSRRGRPYHADITKLLAPTYAVFAVLVLLGLSALFLDIAHPAANPFH